jgi:hypothetical protein
MMKNLIRRFSGDDQGIAMLTVIMYLVIFSLLGGTLFYVSLNAIPQSRHHQNYEAALGAAEAGVDDYLDRLAQDYNYATDPPDGNAALTTDPTKCVPIGGTAKGCYEYSVDTSQLSSTGTLFLYSTGIVNGVSRTVKVGLRPVGFLDALSTSDYNLVDPSLYPVVSGSVSQTTTECVWHAWEKNTAMGGTGPYSAHCGGLLNYWVHGNVFNGPMQSNDDYYLCQDPQFNDTISSGDPATSGTYWKDPAGCSGDNPYFKYGGIAGQHTVSFPPAASSIKTAVAVGGTNTGCLYTGPTSITLNGNKMNVISPYTKSTNAGCGPGNNLNLPVNGTIYVQSIPGAAGDPNYTAAGSCVNAASWTGDACTSGDAFVQGTLAGQLTIAVDNNIFLTGSTTYDSFSASAPRRVLGLIATNAILVNHTTTTGSACNGYATYNGYCNFHGQVTFGTGANTIKYTLPVTSPTINAAILSLQHAFGVADFDHGPFGADLGTINLTGAVAEKFMDTEGVFTGSGQVTGYGVNYSYDTRFKSGGLTPPNFLDPTKSYWHRVSFAECPYEGATNCHS